MWRKERNVLTGEELQSTWTMQQAPPDVPVWESADTLDMPAHATTVTWYHRNAYSIVPLTLKHQGLDEFKSVVGDPLVNRTFGGRILAREFKRGRAGCPEVAHDAPLPRAGGGALVADGVGGGWLKQVSDLAKRPLGPRSAKGKQRPGGTPSGIAAGSSWTATGAT